MDKNKLTPWEAKRNLSEIVEKIGAEHAREVQNKISDAIFEELSYQFGETLHQTYDEDDTLGQAIDIYELEE